ncbi:MAG: DUF4492 domain-containing protein [Bacteroidales bacterium]|nr:DUF4492 domain-containing protein [Bacteroidales bacterium]
MPNQPNLASRIWGFYRDGFRNMTWGRPLVWLIVLKLFVLFAILRVFFFKPAMAGMSEEQKIEAVGERLAGGATDPNDTLTLN